MICMKYVFSERSSGGWKENRNLIGSKWNLICNLTLLWQVWNWFKFISTSQEGLELCLFITADFLALLFHLTSI